MRDVAIVTTTINYPRRAFTEFARGGHLVVAGDLKTPPETAELVRSLGGTYLAPDDQKSWRCSDEIGWASIQRRNVAFLEAARLGASVVISVDDDNFPEDATTWSSQHVNAVNRTSVLFCTTESGWFNPGSLLEPAVYARGMPYHEVVADRRATEYRGLYRGDDAQIGVNCGLWLGDPDVDALQRIANRPDVERSVFNRTVAKPGTWSPINSQNTAWRRELLPLATVLPHVGRWDDILGGYAAEWSMRAAGFSVAYGEPCVRQERNDHDLWHDLDLEIEWIKRTPEWCGLLDSLTATGDPLFDLDTLAHVIDQKPWSATFADVGRFLHAWVEDCDSIR